MLTGPDGRGGAAPRHGCGRAPPAQACRRARPGGGGAGHACLHVHVEHGGYVADVGHLPSRASQHQPAAAPAPLAKEKEHTPAPVTAGPPPGSRAALRIARAAAP